MHRILIIEDDTETNILLTEGLRKAGYSCTQAFSGTEGLFYLERDPFSLVVLEQMLGGMGSNEVVSRMPKSQQLPIILVSAKNAPRDKIKLSSPDTGLNGNEQMEVQKLISQIELQMRHHSADPGNTPTKILKYRGLVLDTSSYIARIKGYELPLTRQEFKILELLVSYPAHVFTKQNIYDYAWDDFYAGDNKTVNVHISNIRKKLKEHTDFEYIQTVWGCGFRLGK